MVMDRKGLQNDIKTGTYKKVYLLFGEESYLVNTMEERLRQSIIPPEADLMNYDFFEGKQVPVGNIVDAVETLPFLNEYRLVIVKNSQLFATNSGRKADAESMLSYLDSSTPDSTVLLFVEENVDKRSRLYKKAGEVGAVVECKALGESELVAWVVRFFKKEGKDIANGTAVHFLRTVGFSMENAHTEGEKLISYAGERTEIVAHDVDSICTKSLDVRIFDLMNAIGSKRLEKALDIYAHMILMKESPLMVLVMIARQFRMILQCGYLQSKNVSPNDIASKTGIRSFVVKDYIAQSKRFSRKVLLHGLKDCLQTDVNIKTGKMEEKLAVEMLIIEYSK